MECPRVQKLDEFEIDKRYSLQTWLHRDGSIKVYPCYQSQIISMSSTKSIYKFYGLGSNSLDSFINNYFWMGHPNTFNDPFDFNLNLIHGLDNKSQEKLKRIGVCCFAKKRDHQLMWGHYGKGLTGFALKIKRSIGEVRVPENPELRDGIPERLFHPVIYTDSFKKVNLSNIKNSKIAEYYISLIKSKPWSYEKEVRLVVFGLPQDQRKIWYNPEIIEEIYIGNRALNEQKPETRILINEILNNYQSRKIYVVHPNSNKVALKFLKVDISDLENYLGGGTFNI